jgi:hypothetical protein
VLRAEENRLSDVAHSWKKEFPLIAFFLLYVVVVAAALFAIRFDSIRI